MNQQEIDRLWARHCGKHDLMLRTEFTAAIQEAVAQARRQALEEAAVVCMRNRCLDDMGIVTIQAANSASAACANAIRALMAQEAV